MRKIFLLITISFFNCLFGQLEPKSIKSPDVSAIEKYGKYGVSLSTGTVNVNIPLYQTNIKDSQLDLNLNYDTSGLKISEPAGITGMNWTLQQPGVISRNIKGIKDEFKSTTVNGRGHFYEYTALDIPNIETQTVYDSFESAFYPGDSQDLEPDIFSFTVMGKSGKFFLGQDGVWKVQSDHNFNVIINESDFVRPFNYYPAVKTVNYDYNGNPMEADVSSDGLVIGKITMIDDLGTQYIFGSSTNSIEYTANNFFYQKKGSEINSTAWYLDEVKDRTGETLFLFSYERDKPIARFYNNVDHPNKDYLYKLLSGSIISPIYLSAINTKNENVIFEYSDRNDLSFANEANIEYKFQKIKTDNGTQVDPNWPDKLFFLYTNFNQNSAAQLNSSVYVNWANASSLLKWKKLDKIVIKNTNGLIKREIILEYIEKPTERLFLTKVKFKNNSTEYSYKIKYNNGNGYEYNFDGSLPNYLWLRKNIFDNYSSTGIGNDNSTLCYIDCGGFDNDNLVKKGSLLKIIYPTGGFTYFDFEQNIFSKFLQKSGSSLNILQSSKRKGGGLRIKKIVNFPDINSTKRETIYYDYSLDDYNSSGILSIDANFLEPTNDLPWFEKFNIVGNGVKFSYNGPAVLYSKVTETRANESGVQKTENYFSNYDTSNYYLDKPYIIKVSGAWGIENILTDYIDKSFIRGKLLEKKVFDANNNLLIHSNYQYKGLDSFLGKFVYSSSHQSIPTALRKIYYGDFQLEKEFKKEYFNGKEINTEVLYDWVDYPYQISGSSIFSGSQRLNFTSTILPDGNILKTQTEYQYNCTSGYCHDEIFALPKKISNFKNSNLLKENVFIYKPLNANPKSLVVDELKETYFNSPNQSSKLKFTKYDVYGNIIEYNKQNGNYISIIMDSNGSKPLAKIEGALYSDLTPYLSDIQKPYVSNSSEALLNLSDPFTYATQKDIELRGHVSNLRKNLLNTLVTSYTYDSYDRLKTITQPNGSVEFYEYDNLGRLLNIKDVDGNILKEYQYNYTSNNSGDYPFLLEEITNEETKFTFIKKNCAAGEIGDIYKYTIPAGKYKSLISQADLFVKLNNDKELNGQNFANLYGNCLVTNSYGLGGLSTIELQTSSLYLNTNNVTGYFVFKPLSNFEPQQENFIAVVPNDMKPSVNRNFSFHQQGPDVDRYWSFTINTEGYLLAIMSGTPLLSDEIININSFQYEK